MIALTTGRPGWGLLAAIAGLLLLVGAALPGQAATAAAPVVTHHDHALHDRDDAPERLPASAGRLVEADLAMDCDTTGGHADRHGDGHENAGNCCGTACHTGTLPTAVAETGAARNRPGTEILFDLTGSSPPIPDRPPRT